MHSRFVFARRHGRFLLLALALGVSLAAGLGWGGAAWLLMVPSLFLLGRSYGADPSGQGQYGVGAALAGFRPRR